MAENADLIAQKLGFRLKLVAAASLDAETRTLPPQLGDVMKTTDWRQVVCHPQVQIVVEVVGGTTIAKQVVEAAIQNKKSVVTANKELMAASGPEIWEHAIRGGVNLAMEASVAAESRFTLSCAKAFPATALLRSTESSTAPATIF